MKVALTGATGFIGSHVLTELHKHGHEVTALVRDDAQADIVAARGATPTVVDLYDRPAVASLLGDADAAIHTASPGDATSADLDSAVVDAAIDAFAGTGKPYLHISGAWVYGANPAITEESPFNPPAMVAWKEPIERRVLDADGHARSRDRLQRRLRRRRRRDSRAAARLTPRRRRQPDHARHRDNSTGRRCTSPTWRTSSAASLEDDSAHGYYVIGDGQNPTVAELTEAAAVAAGAPGAVPGSDEEARARLGDYFAEVLLLDQSTDAAKARDRARLAPVPSGLVDEFRHGSYRKV